MNLNTQKTPNEDIEKPEPLKHELSVYWSRRINDEHRIVYKQQDDTILIAQLLNCATTNVHKETADEIALQFE